MPRFVKYKQDAVIALGQHVKTKYKSLTFDTTRGGGYFQGRLS